MDLKHQITNIFVQINDFCKEFEAQIKKNEAPSTRR
ncbi:hypothetical protein CHRY9393_01918 [Chryseobacterium fistulae]|uniref:IS982 family transposase n=1 Tax=Chryseobacterium fistulae TaxID=2675058 RepID=A0A6N4XP63_9FLAO|nr:hypothetical protein CHRY9393_01918 [Chryseobacterium fistulae]